MGRIGIIAGTGFYELPALAESAPEVVETRYGSALVTSGLWHGLEVSFLTRHGVDHSVPPSAVNYRANITALKDLKVNRVIAINVVGGIDPSLKAGDLSLIDDFIDFTSGRQATFFDGLQLDGSRYNEELFVDGQYDGVQHVDVSDAYDRDIRRALSVSAQKSLIPLREKGIYAGFNGPRFETPSEIRLAALAGATVVGMTGCPEVSLAREAGLRYASIALVVNPAAGVSDQPITMEEIKESLAQASAKVITIIDGAIELI